MALGRGSTNTKGKSERRETYPHLEGFLGEVSWKMVFREGWMWREEEGPSRQKNLACEGPKGE